jgi:hypothetical protein
MVLIVRGLHHDPRSSRARPVPEGARRAWRQESLHIEIPKEPEQLEQLPKLLVAVWAIAAKKCPVMEHEEHLLGRHRGSDEVRIRLPIGELGSFDKAQDFLERIEVSIDVPPQIAVPRHIGLSRRERIFVHRGLRQELVVASA